MNKDFCVLKDSFGCDFVVNLPKSRKNTPIKILQLTDPQIIDSSQRRTPDRLNPSEIEAWAPENFDVQCGNHIRSLLCQTHPDLIFITGDIVYGEFDDNGTALKWFTEFMDSFGIPWAPVFGNHDNDSKMGVAYQCKLFEDAPNCLFKRNTVTGNGNYTVGVAVDNELVRVIHMTDSNGCHSDDPEVTSIWGIYPDQFDRIQNATNAIRDYAKKDVPAFIAFHIPHAIFIEAEKAKGYVTPDRYNYIIGVDVPAQDGDFGFKLDSANAFPDKNNFLEFAKQNNIDGVFIGHHHNTSTIIHYQGIALVYGLKTGQYDSYIPGNLGGTLITQQKDEFSVLNICSCCRYGPVPHDQLRYKGFFQE